MQMSAVFEDGIHAFRDTAGLHLVIADSFAVDGEVENGAELFGGDVGGYELAHGTRPKKQKREFHGLAGME
jgi:hypothetical protein